MRKNECNIRIREGAPFKIIQRIKRQERQALPDRMSTRVFSDSIRHSRDATLLNQVLLPTVRWLEEELAGTAFAMMRAAIYI